LKEQPNSDSEEEEQTVHKTAAEETQPKKRSRGRPKGSRNKLTADARSVLAQHGLAGLRMLCRIAAGQPVYRPRGKDGSREKLVPTLDQMLKAQYSVVDRLVPSLKATELTGADGNPIATQDVGHDEHHPRDIARAMLAVLRDAEIAGGGPGPLPAFIDLAGQPQATGAAPTHDPTAWQKDAAANPWKTRKIGEGELGAPVANGGAATAVGGDFSSPSAADDYQALNKELSVGGCEILNPHLDHSQGIQGRDPSANGSIYPGPWPGTGADHAARREERPPPGMTGQAPPSKYQEGDKLPVEGCWIEFVMFDAAGVRSKWRIVGKDGARHCAIWGEPEARRAAEELSRFGRITR
jgi:hypothetical protein